MPYSDPCPVSFLPRSIKLPVNLKLCPSHVLLVSWYLWGQKATKVLQAGRRRSSGDSPQILESRKSSRRNKRGLGLLFSMGKPTVVANQCAWRSAPSQCQDALLHPWFPCSLRNLFGDQTPDKNEKAGKQRARFRAVVFDFPRF